jgi:hypothetical protein
MSETNHCNKAEEYYRRAAEVRRYVREGRWPAAREELLDIERRWLKLAQSYEFAERFDRFLANVGKRQASSEPRSVPSAISLLVARVQKWRSGLDAASQQNLRVAGATESRQGQGIPV